MLEFKLQSKMQPDARVASPLLSSVSGALSGGMGFSARLPEALAGATEAQARVLAALERRQFFKLIGGGSFTEPEKIAHLVAAYTRAGVDCLDVAPDVRVLQAVEWVLSQHEGTKPLVMVSVPLDPDPHFRKIELEEPDCIRCGACVPVCPTEAITLPVALEISQSLCYGCGRCVPVCPTQALSLLPFQVDSQLAEALAHPGVEAVEIHSHYVDPDMLAAFLARWRPWLAHKLLALCFRPQGVPEPQIRAFYQVAADHSELPVILQIDGAPMSGNDDPAASLPALDAAVLARGILGQAAQSEGEMPYITISGGINAHTAQWLKQDAYVFVAGVGMGTVARKAIWHLSPGQAEQQAAAFVRPFQNRA